MSETDKPAQLSFFAANVDLPAIDAEAVKQWLLAVCQAENKKLGELSYIFCSDKYLLDINRRFLQHDFFTDIITFPYTYNPIIAEMYISTERVADNAGQLGLNADEELKRVIVHGLLHLCGYDDHTDESKQLMRNREDYYLQLYHA